METDIHTASSAVDDRGESITQMEPLRLRDGSRNRTDLTDMSVELAMQSTGFRRSLPDGLLTALATLPPKSSAVLEAVLFRGSLPRGDVPGLLGIGDRQARRVTSTLLEREVLVSENPRAPLRLAFPAKLASRWLPGLFPEG